MRLASQLPLPVLRLLPAAYRARRAGSPARFALTIGKLVVADAAIGWTWSTIVWPLLPVAAVVLFCALPLGFLALLGGLLELAGGSPRLALFFFELGGLVVVGSVVFLAFFGGLIGGGVWLLGRVR